MSSLSVWSAIVQGSLYFICHQFASYLGIQLCCLGVDIEEHIPCIVISNKGCTFCLIAYPIVCHIAIGIVIDNEGMQSLDCTQKGIVLYQGEANLASCDVANDGHLFEVSVSRGRFPPVEPI